MSIFYHHFQDFYLWQFRSWVKVIEVKIFSQREFQFLNSCFCKGRENKMRLPSYLDINQQCQQNFSNSKTFFIFISISMQICKYVHVCKQVLSQSNLFFTTPRHTEMFWKFRKLSQSFQNSFAFHGLKILSGLAFLTNMILECK